jgi:hypothetical protein
MRGIPAVLCLLWSGITLAGVSSWIPFHSSGGHIVIPVIVNGEAGEAILDSGASGNAISEAFLKRHEGEYGEGKQIVVRGAYGSRRVNLINNIQVEMFGSEFRLDQLMPARMGSYELVVGLPFFENFIIQIDYPRGNLRLIDHESLDLKQVANVKMKRAKGSAHPIVQLNLNGEYDPWITLDTGSNGGLLLRRFDAERFGWLDKYESDAGYSAGATSVASVERFTLPTVEIGPFVLENVTVTVPGEGQNANIGQDDARSSSRIRKDPSAGILGYGVLKHFIVTIDFKRSLLFLEIPPD